MLTDAQLAKVRSRFSIFRRKIYLNSCSQGALSDAVESRMREYLESWQREGSPWETWVGMYEGARSAFARLIGAEVEEVAVVPSASAGINAVASALDFSGRKRVLMGEFEFPTMGHIWLAQRARGAQVEFLPASNERISALAYQQRVDRDTLIVPVTRVCFSNGFRSPIAEIARAARANRALVLLDDYQDCGTRPVNVRELGVDFYVTGALKYLLGPAGVAFLYVRRELVGRLEPTITGWFAQRDPFAFDAMRLDLAPSARRFEAGTAPIPCLYGAAAGIELLESVGMEAIADHVAGLARTLIRSAAELRVALKTPRESEGPLVVLEAKDADGFLEKLAERGIVASTRRNGVRISFHVYNTLDDVQEVVRVTERHRELLVADPS